MDEAVIRIFLVDDDDDDREFFTDVLHEMFPNIVIDTFDNGVSLMGALLTSRDRPPDIVFIDLFMPLMDGEECLADIRTEPVFATLPIVIYSGYPDKEWVDSLMEQGADRYLQKPTTFRDMKTALSECLISFGLVGP